MASVVSFLGSKKAVLKAIREIVLNDSGRVEFNRLLEKGIVGDVSMSQIWRCLERGDITRDPWVDDTGDVHCEMSIVTAGQEVFVVVAIKGADVKTRMLHVIHVEDG